MLKQRSISVGVVVVSVSPHVSFDVPDAVACCSIWSHCSAKTVSLFLLRRLFVALASLGDDGVLDEVRLEIRLLAICFPCESSLLGYITILINLSLTWK